MIQLAWRFLMFQKDSALAQWFYACTKNAPPIRAGRIPIATTEDLDTVASIWILSCNDQNPIITYKGISSRLDLPDTFDVKALVRSRRELFRRGILDSRLQTWKGKLKRGQSTLPDWIAEIEDNKARDEAIGDLSKDDVFRNQFRTRDDAAQCSIEILDWGLSHIDRLRETTAEEQEAKTKKWGTIIIPVFSIALAVLSVFATTWLQLTSIREQSAMKRYEVSFKPKQEAYSKFMISITDSAMSAAAQEKENVLKQLSQAEQAYFLFEPFLDENMRTEMTQRLAKFDGLCIQAVKASRSADSAEHRDFLQQVGNYKAYFQVRLYDSLFGRNATQ